MCSTWNVSCRLSVRSPGYNSADVKRRKSARLKKKDEYEKDHRTRMENPHAFRKNWPKKKARANRRSRRKLDMLLLSERDVTPAMMKAALGPRAISKDGVMSLREMIRLKREIRERRANGKRFKL